MLEDEDNMGLKRVEYALRSTGVPAETLNPLRSGIHSRGYLPHVKREGASYFVTFRLADSLPQQVLMGFKRQQAEKLRAISNTSLAVQEEIAREYRRQVERYLDRGSGQCYLRRPEVAQMVAEALVHSHGQQYLLGDWVIMPNHVHLVVWPCPNFTLSEILQSRKRWTARQANLLLGRTGQVLWEHESFDHWIRNEEEKQRIGRYISNNPVTARLCKSPQEWPWGSAGFKQMR